MNTYWELIQQNELEKTAGLPTALRRISQFSSEYSKLPTVAKNRILANKAGGNAAWDATVAKGKAGLLDRLRYRKTINSSKAKLEAAKAKGRRLKGK